MKSGTGVPATERIGARLRGSPRPSTVNHEPPAYRVDTIIWFSVRVPVLSVLIALVAPSVSTSVRFLTTALASASWRRAHREQAGDEGRHAGRDGRDRHRGAEQQQLVGRHPAEQPDHDDDGDRRPRR